jgi:TRAP-type C4-dicarboxylate transport system substrate-binding protein
MRGYQDKSFYVIGLIVNPPNMLHSKEPIVRLEDMKGKRIQASGTEQQELVRALGATPVGTVTVRDAAEAISRGVIDGTPKDWLAMHSFRISDAAPHHVNLPMGASTIMFAMNRAKYDSLPEKARAAIDKHSGEQFVRITGQMFDAYTLKDYQKTLADKKHTVVQLAPAEKARWDKSMDGVIESWRNKDKVNETLWQAFLKTRADVRSELGKRTP